jgi:phosphatidylglycerophosphatase A
MTIKESSDELNESVAIGDARLPRPRARTPKDFFALGIATCGVGYLPIAPGTWGSLLAVALFLIARLGVSGQEGSVGLAFGPYAFPAIGLLAILLVTFIGIWAASRTERVLRIKDPGKVVIDEVAGQWIALWPLTFAGIGRWPLSVIIAFLLFRLFDIVKPYPARKMESLKGGLGIMADDLVAGAYAALLVTGAVLIPRFI